MPNVNINDTIEQIAVEIANRYNLKPFPKVIDEQGFLIFPEKTEPNSRGKYGHLKAARLAAIVPYVAALYQKHGAIFNEQFKAQINTEITAENIKLLQIAALMRHSGRWHAPNVDPLSADSKEFAAQSSKECAKFLQQLGLGQEIIDSAVKCLLEVDSAINLVDLGIMPAILRDAVNLAENSEVKQDTSPFCQHVQVA